MTLPKDQTMRTDDVAHLQAVNRVSDGDHEECLTANLN